MVKALGKVDRSQFRTWRWIDIPFSPCFYFLDHQSHLQLHWINDRIRLHNRHLDRISCSNYFITSTQTICWVHRNGTYFLVIASGVLIRVPSFFVISNDHKFWKFNIFTIENYDATGPNRVWATFPITFVAVFY
jgi:hypothetical protein